jgi:hypothetical protein
LLITLKVDKKSNTLIAKISWFEKTINNQKEITLYVTNFHAHANNTTIAIIIAFIIFAMGILGLGGYLIYQKKHSRKLTMPPE